MFGKLASGKVRAMCNPVITVDRCITSYRSCDPDITIGDKHRYELDSSGNVCVSHGIIGCCYY